MNSDLQKTVHYTTESQKICANLIKYIPNNAQLIEPFVGGGDLINLFPNHSWEKFDIEDNGNNIVQDTLKRPPLYKNKWVITNPPYLAQNKARDKSIFDLYNTDDLYKAAILSILDCEGGILIIPTNFFTDERSYEVREKFLNQFKILEINVFTEPVFETTTYSICSFAFIRKKESDTTKQVIKVNIKPEEKEVFITLYSDYKYRIAGEFYDKINSVDNIFSRLVVGNDTDKYITNIKLYAIDTRNERIRVEFDKKHFYGKATDRTYATFICDEKLDEDFEKLLINKFNFELENFRKQYSDLSMTNYRDYNRKRISFTFAYNLMSKIYMELKENI